MAGMNAETVFDKHMEAMLALALSEDDRCAETPLTPEEEEICRRAWNAFEERWQERGRNRRRARMKARLRRGLQAAACAALAVAISVPIALAASAELRSRVMKLLMVTTPQYTALSLVEEPEEAFFVPAGYPGQWYMSWIPEGYEYVDAGNFIAGVRYRDARGNRLGFDELTENDAVNIDTEGADVREVLVDGRRVTVISENATSMAVWSADDRYFIIDMDNIDGTVPEEDALLRVVAGVKRIIE